MTEILGEFEHQISGVTLTPSRGGVFEVLVGDDLVYSKEQTGRHAEEGEVLGLVREKLG